MTLHHQRQFQHSRFALLVFGLLGPFMLASYLLFMDAYGQNYPFSCFIRNDNQLYVAIKFFGFYLFLFSSTAFNIAALVYVSREYNRTRLSKRPLLILMLYPVAILMSWLLMMVQDLYFYITAEYQHDLLVASLAFTNLNGKYYSPIPS